MRNRLMPKNNRGFTLIELLVVIAIISLLSSIVLASLQEARDRAAISGMQRSGQELRNALELYRNANDGSYPGPFSPGEYSGSGNSTTVARLLNSSFIEDELGDYLSDFNFPHQQANSFSLVSSSGLYNIYYNMPNHWGSNSHPGCGEAGYSGLLDYVVYFQVLPAGSLDEHFPRLYLNDNSLAGQYYCLFSPLK